MNNALLCLNTGNFSENVLTQDIGSVTVVVGGGVERGIRPLALQIFKIAGCRHHSTVVSAQGDGRGDQTRTVALAGILQLTAKMRVGRYAACQNDRFMSCLRQRLSDLLGNAAHDGMGIGGRQIGAVDLLLLLLGLIDQIERRRFQTAEGEVQRVSRQRGGRKRIGLGITLIRLSSAAPPG